MINGCNFNASAGSMQIKDETQESVASKIIKGKTTKQEVRIMFGDPSNTNFTDSGNEVWQYYYAKARPKPINFVPVASGFSSGHNIDRKELAIIFDKDGVVMNFSMQNAQEEIRRGAGS